MSALLAPPASPAAAWRDSLAAMHARNVDDQLVAALDALAETVRTAVVTKLEMAMRSGVYDPFTLTTITEVVAANHAG